MKKTIKSKIKINECINKIFHLNNLKNKIFKKNRIFYNKCIYQILLLLILDILFFSLNTSEKSVYEITCIFEGIGDGFLLNPYVQMPDIIRINDHQEYLSNTYYVFTEEINKIEFTWYNRPSCKYMFFQCEN